METNNYQKEQFSSYIEQSENNTEIKNDKENIISFFENYFYKNYKI